MKFIKVLNFIIGAIALFPSISHAENTSANNQKVGTATTIYSPALDPHFLPKHK